VSLDESSVWHMMVASRAILAIYRAPGSVNGTAARVHAWPCSMNRADDTHLASPVKNARYIELPPVVMHCSTDRVNVERRPLIGYLNDRHE